MARLSVVSVADRSGYYIFASALRASDHGARLEGDGAFTLFAPSDAAFSAYSPVELDKFLRQDRERLN
ncbi:MAG TPA: fasciclin domain-containing protein, partial [Verrucomicrobiae bacterium]|nr:fasciclin domain-containing protein [Verrucomicrobiae bacterium]